MDERQSVSRRARVSLAAMFVSGALALYIYGYVAGTRQMGHMNVSGARIRLYATRFQAIIFLPAAKIETVATGKPMHTGVTTGVFPLSE